MSFGVRVALVVINLPDCEGLYLSTVALQVLETKNRHPSASSTIVQQIFQIILAILLNFFPKPLNNFVIFFKPLIVGELSPVLDINIGWPVQYHLELVRLEDREKFFRDNLVQGISQNGDVVLDTFGTVKVDSR